ncbi:MAG: hypothetical protein HY554_10480 [Elusimicrobia bacterium]|nr:hypothetical protein [Elusimicrobiota bacterium]
MTPWLALYQLAFPAVGVAVAAKMLAGGRGATLREGASDLGQRLGSVDAALLRRLGKRALWLHAASVGELAGAAALLRALPERPPPWRSTGARAGPRAGRAGAPRPRPALRRSQRAA